MGTKEKVKSTEISLKIQEKVELVIPKTINKILSIDFEIESHPYKGRPSELTKKLSEIFAESGGVLTFDEIENQLDEDGWNTTNLGHKLRVERNAGRISSFTMTYQRGDSEERIYKLKYFFMNPSAEGEFADWDRKEFSGELTPEQVQFLRALSESDRPTIIKSDTSDLDTNIYQIERMFKEGILQKRGAEYTLSPEVIASLLSRSSEQEGIHIENYDYPTFERVVFTPEVQGELEKINPSGFHKRTDIERASGFAGKLSQSTISKYLRKLEEKGKVRIHGEKPFEIRWEFLTEGESTQHPSEELETIVETPDFEIEVQETDEKDTSVPIQFEPEITGGRGGKLTVEQVYKILQTGLDRGELQKKAKEKYGTLELSRSQIEEVTELQGKISYKTMSRVLENLTIGGYVTKKGERKGRKYGLTGKVPLEDVFTEEVDTEIPEEVVIKPLVEKRKEVETTIRIDELMLSGTEESKEDFRRFMTEIMLDRTHISQEHTTPLSGKGKSCLDYIIDGLEKRRIQHLVRFLIEGSITDICCPGDKENRVYPKKEVIPVIQKIMADQTLPLLKKKNGDYLFDKKLMITMGLREARAAGEGKEYQEKIIGNELVYRPASE